MTVLGTIVGMKTSKCMIRKLGGRNSYLVLLMVFVIVTIMVATIVITID